MPPPAPVVPSGPHRHPFRFIDRTDPDGRACVVVSDGAVYHRMGGCLPLTLSIEIMAQGALASMDGPNGLGGGQASTLRLVGIDGARLHRPARAGDRLWVATRIGGRFGAIIKVACRVEGVDGGLIAAADLLLAGA